MRIDPQPSQPRWVGWLLLTGLFLLLISLLSCDSTPTAPTPPPATPEPPRSTWNAALWRHLVFGEADGIDPRSNTARVLPLSAERITAVPVVVQEHPALKGLAAEIEDVLNEVARQLFGRPWSGGPLRWEAAPDGGAGALTVLLVQIDGCGDALLGAPDAGRVRIAPDCLTRLTPEAFRAVLAHEIGHALGFYHQTAVPGGLMNPVLNVANPPRRDSAAIREEARVARVRLPGRPRRPVRRPTEKPAVCE